ncbi:MAG: hypothetical protein ACR2LC_02715 [Pyrinomonadaceae bacterium]
MKLTEPTEIDGTTIIGAASEGRIRELLHTEPGSPLPAAKVYHDAVIVALPPANTLGQPPVQL